MRKAYHWLSKTVTNKTHQAIVNGLLLALGLHVSIQKVAGLSLSTLLHNLLSPAGFYWVKVAAITGIIYASVVKLITHFMDSHPPLSTKTQEPERISECALVINDEIKRHLRDIISNPKASSQTFLKSHNFDVNVAHVVSSLADHLKRAFSHLKVRNRDIFISVYQLEHLESKMPPSQSLIYLTHWEPSRDVVFSKKIEPNRREFKTYECVKAINEGKSSVIKWNCSDYAKSKNSRGKIKHYIGFKFEFDGAILGFMNIEFHNTQLFLEEEKMLDFVEKEIIAFKYLVEYQFLKRRFFCAVNENWIKEAA
jgi:hypothetical protein